MLKNLIYKKDYWLVAAAILLLVVCYQLAFKKTVEAYQTRNRLQAQVSQVSDVSYEPGYLERKAGNIDRILARYRMDTLALRGNALAQIAVIAERENVKLSEVPLQDPSFNTAHFIIQQLEFEGSYPALLKTFHDLENMANVGVPRSITIKTVSKNTGNKEDKKTVMDVLMEVKK